MTFEPLSTTEGPIAEGHGSLEVTARIVDGALRAIARFGLTKLTVDVVGHEALQHLLATEPGTVLPHLCFSGADTLLRVAADRIAPHLCRFMGPLEARRTGELLARIVLSYGLAPPPVPTTE